MNIRQRKGEGAEHRFDAEIIERGLYTLQPQVTVPYDRMVEGGSQWRPRVQVKSSRTEIRSGSGTFLVVIAAGEENKYDKDDFDFLAAYVQPKRDWYIIPAELVIHKQGIGVSRSGKWSRYRDAWDLLVPPHLVAESAVSDRAESSPESVILQLGMFDDDDLE